MLTTTSRIELLNDWAAVDQLDWDRLLVHSATPSVFQTSEWLRAWWTSFGRGRLLIIAAYERDELIAIAPLFADHGMVYFVGSGGSDYLDFVGTISDPNVLAAILDKARAHAPGFVGFRFYHVPQGSPTGTMLAACAQQLGLTCFDEGWLNAPALRFRDWPENQKPPAEKKSLVRHERGLQKIGRLEIEHFALSAQIEPQLPTFFGQHIMRWAATPFPSLFLDDRQRQFYHRLCSVFDLRGWLRFTRVSLNDEPLAFHFGFQFQDSFLWYKPTFNIERAHHSPGEVLLRALILHAQRERVDLFDFGLGDEAFKNRFATETNRVQTWGLYP